MLDEQMPWQAPGRPQWACRRCGFTSPVWDAAGAFPLCCRCEQQDREARLQPYRASLAADRAQAMLNGHAPSGFVMIGTPVVMRETERAILFRWRNGTEAWAPRAAALLPEPAREGTCVKNWLFRKWREEGLNIEAS